VRSVLLGSVDPLSSLAGKVWSGGRLNLNRALTVVHDFSAPTNVHISSALPRVVRAKSFPVAWTASDPSGISTFDLRYRKARYDGSYGSFVTWKTGSHATTATFAGNSGYTYCFSVRARDRAGNLSGWSADRCAAVPLDDDSSALAETSGWSYHTGSSDYFGSDYSLDRRYGETITIHSVVYRELDLIATRCDGCGSIDVFVNGSFVKRLVLDPSGATPLTHSLLAITGHSSTLHGPSTVTLFVRTSNKAVRVEGFAVSHA
jgi:hypothetical protein